MIAITPLQKHTKCYTQIHSKLLAAALHTAKML